MAHFDGTSTWQDVVKELGHNGKGKTYVLTGASQGSMAAQAAIALAQTSPAAIFLLARSAAKVNPVLAEISEISPSTAVEFVQCDNADNASVRAAAAKLKTLLATSSNGAIHGLLNSAGIIATREYRLSKDGVEEQFAVNHMAHFLLTNLLKEELLKGKGVVIQVSSGGFYATDSNFGDPNYNDGKDYNPWLAYARSKAANALFAMALAKRANSAGVLSLSATPGMTRESKLFENNKLDDEHLMGGFLLGQQLGLDPTPYAHQSTKDEGTACLILPFLDPSFRAFPGAYLDQCRASEREEPTLTPEKAEKLWAQSERLLGETFTW